MSEASSFCIGAILTTICLYSLIKFILISRKALYTDNHSIEFDKRSIDIEAVYLIKRSHLNFILKYMWEISKTTVSAVPPDDLIEIHVNEEGKRKKYSFFVNFNDVSTFMTFISHMRARCHHVKIDI